MGRKVSLEVAETPALTPLGSLRPGVRQVCHSLSGHRCSPWQNGVVVNGEGLPGSKASRGPVSANRHPPSPVNVSSVGPKLVRSHENKDLKMFCTLFLLFKCRQVTV